MPRSNIEAAEEPAALTRPAEDGKDTSNPSGVVFDIQRHALHDGPGIRTTVFLKGCCFHCPWCHNPESMLRAPEPDRLNPERHFGDVRTVSEVMAEVLKDVAYYRSSGGGITVSGGEPFVQFNFLMALLRAARAAGISTCVDTTGHVPTAQLEQSLPLTDVYHYDYKDTDPDRHRRLTGGDLSLVLKNLDFLHSRGASVILRCPLIPGINDDDLHFRGIAGIAKKFPFMPVEILPYHDMGRGKWERVGKIWELKNTPPTSAEKKAEWRRRFDALGAKVLLA